MTNKDLIKAYPSKRIQPVDGMPVTAGVWEEAHDYHNNYLRFHNVLNHRSGIVTGLEIIASDPPDTSVYILPGIAVDPVGRTIVLPQPLAYDVGHNSDGLLYILLTYGEGRPKADDQESTVLYVHSQFGIEALPTLPNTPYVELARVHRETRDSTILLADDPEHPRLNELDLRFRTMIGARQAESMRIAVSYAGKVTDERYAQGASSLARALRRAENLPVWVDINVPLDTGLEVYTVIYLVAQRAFNLSTHETDALRAYLQGGGTLLLESCRKAKSGDAPASDASFGALAAALGVKLHALELGNDLLTNPALFGKPPAGFETEGTPAITIGEGVILSTAGYGRLWLGERRSGPASREEIRAAVEWGSNILHHAAQHRKNAAQ